MTDAIVVRFISTKFTVVDPFATGTYLKPNYEELYDWLSRRLTEKSISNEIVDLNEYGRALHVDYELGFVLKAHISGSNYNLYWGWAPNLEIMENKIGVWKLTIEKQRSYTDRLFRRNKLDEDDKLVGQIVKLFIGNEFTDIETATLAESLSPKLAPLRMGLNHEMKPTFKGTMRFKSSVFLILISLLLPLGWYGVYSWFFTGKVLTILTLGGLFSLSFFISLLIARKPLPRIPRNNYKIRKPVGVLGVFMFIPFMLWMPLGMGLPAVISLTLSPNENMHVRVIDVTSSRSRRSCDHEVKFENISTFLKSGICVSRSEVNMLKVGDILNLHVNKSFLGLRIYSFHGSDE